jgi:hypothetical protein
MRIATTVLVIASILAGCGGKPLRDEPAANLGAVAIVPSRSEPAAQFDPGSHGSAADGAVIGAAGGAGIGAMSAKASAGLLCTVSGPLCLIVMIPAAIVGGLVGGVAGGVVDAATTDPGKRIANARESIEKAVAEMRLTDTVASKTYGQAREANYPVSFLKTDDYRALAAQGIQSVLEVDVTEVQILAKEKEMALALFTRSRVYRTSDGEKVDEREAEVRTEYRRYQDWAADEARPLRLAVDYAAAQLGYKIVSAHLR